MLPGDNVLSQDMLPARPSSVLAEKRQVTTSFQEKGNDLFNCRRLF